MSEYPWNEKNNTFTWLSSLYNPFKRSRWIRKNLYEIENTKNLSKSKIKEIDQNLTELVFLSLISIMMIWDTKV